MKKLAAACFAIACLQSTTVNANIFDFAYSFNNGTVVSGSLTGNLVGDYVQNVGDVEVFNNGIQISGPFIAVDSFNGALDATVSTIASLNNFHFANGLNSYSWTYEFYMHNETWGHSASYRDHATGVSYSDYIENSNNSWSLVERAARISPVPEPVTYVMLLVGLGLIGFMACRKKQIFTA